MVGQLIRQFDYCFMRGGKIFVMGNGGSSAEASHLSEEFISLGYPVLALNDPQVITALANDFGYENVFVKYLTALANPKDMIITLSTSYKSKNILNVIAYAKRESIQLIKLPNIGDTTEVIQNNHLKIIHKLYIHYKKDR